MPTELLGRKCSMLEEYYCKHILYYYNSLTNWLVIVEANNQWDCLTKRPVIEAARFSSSSTVFRHSGHTHSGNWARLSDFAAWSSSDTSYNATRCNALGHTLFMTWMYMLTIIRLKIPIHICVLVSLSPKFHSISLCNHPFFRITDNWTQVHRMTTNWSSPLQG